MMQLKKRRKEFDIVVLLQPTSPLRDRDDIKGALENVDGENIRKMV